MATAWKQGTIRKYVNIAKDGYMDVSLDYINLIDIDTETISASTTEVVSGDCSSVSTTLAYDRDTYGANYHQTTIFLIPNTLGVHTLKTTTTTTLNRIFVHTYDIRTDI